MKKTAAILTGILLMAVMAAGCVGDGGDYWYEVYTIDSFKRERL